MECVVIGRRTLNIEKDTVLISQSQQQSLCTSNQEEADTKIALQCSKLQQASFSKSKRYNIYYF